MSCIRDGVPVSILAHTPIPGMNLVVADQIGWPTSTRQVEATYQANPDVDAIITANYGEAGALVRFGKDLPPVFSGHNTLYDEARPLDDT